MEGAESIVKWHDIGINTEICAIFDFFSKKIRWNDLFNLNNGSIHAMWKPVTSLIKKKPFQTQTKSHRHATCIQTKTRRWKKLQRSVCFNDIFKFLKRIHIIAVGSQHLNNQKSNYFIKTCSFISQNITVMFFRFDSVLAKASSCWHWALSIEHKIFQYIPVMNKIVLPDPISANFPYQHVCVNIRDSHG